MAEQDEVTAEQAEALFAESFAKVTGKEYVATVVVDNTPALEVKEEPVVETKVEEVKDTPTEKVEPVVEKKDEPAPSADEKKDDAYAWVESLPDTIKGKVLNEINARVQGEHYKKSNEGRIAAYQRQLLEAERAISKLQPTDKNPPAPADRSTKTPEEWTKLAKDDPEIANAVEARVKSEVDAAVSALQAEIQGLRKSDDVLYQHEQRQYIERERQALQAMVPNYVEVMNSKEFQEWRDNDAGPALRETAMKSPDHRDAVRVLQAYADDMIRSGRVTPREERNVTSQGTTKTPEQLVAEQAAKTEADRIAAERELRSKQATPTTTPAATFAGTGGAAVQYKEGSAELEDYFQKAWAKVDSKKT